MILIDGFEIDVTLSEDHSFDSEVTEHPVESGADVADHVRARPIVVVLECQVSNTPIGALRDRRTSGLGALSTAQTSNQAFTKLLAVRDAREPVSITTALRQYDNMLLESLSVPMDATDGITFRATFKQVLIVKNERTVVQVKEPRDAKKQNRGNKAPTAVPLTPAQQAPSPTQKAEIKSFLGDSSHKRADLMNFLSPGH